MFRPTTILNMEHPTPLGLFSVLSLLLSADEQDVSRGRDVAHDRL
jgi:hypothetical protein